MCVPSYAFEIQVMGIVWETSMAVTVPSIFFILWLILMINTYNELFFITGIPIEKMVRACTFSG